MRPLSIFNYSALFASIAIASGAVHAATQNINLSQPEALAGAVNVGKNSIVISRGGEYNLSGDSAGRSVVIDAGDDEITLLLNNAQLTSKQSAALHVKKSGDVTLRLAENTSNLIADSKGRVGSDEPQGALYSRADLRIEGAKDATLTVKGQREDAIVGKDDLDLRNLTLTVEAKDEGIRGKDSVDIRRSIVNIVAGGDAIKSDNLEREDKGFVNLEDSDVTLSAGDDGIMAANKVDIRGGNLRITQSYEAIEGRFVTIHSGNIEVNSKDDGFNVTIKKTAEEKAAEEAARQAARDSGERRGPGGPGGHGKAIDGLLSIQGGYIIIHASGDGFDSNGHAEMTGGTLIVNGPLGQGDGYIDVDGTFNLTGGTLIAHGSKGMAQTPSDTSSQPIMQINLDEALSKGDHFVISAANGEQLLDYVAPRNFQSLTYSSALLKNGETYTVTVADKEIASMTLESVITKHGEAGRGPRGPRGDRAWWQFRSDDERPPRPE